MEVFLRGLPDGTRSKKIKSQLAAIVRNTLGQRVEFDWQRLYGKSRACGKLTLPTIEMGQKFLDTNRNGILMRARNGRYQTVKVSLSRNPVERLLVEGLQRRMKERLSRSNSEDENSAIPGHIFLRFTRLQWGVWLSDGRFGHCGTTERGGRIMYSSETGEIKADEISEALPENEDESGIDIDHTTVHELFVELDPLRPRLFLTLDRIPRFWSNNPERHTVSDIYKGMREGNVFFAFFNEEPPTYRLPGLCSEHAVDAAYCTVYVFDLEATTTQNQLSRFSKSMKSDLPIYAAKRISTIPLNFSETHQQLESLYRSYDYTVAFQLESYVRNCLLIPNEVLDLCEQIRMLVHINGVELTVRILQKFAHQLPIRTYEGLSSSLDLRAMLLNSADKDDLWEPIQDPSSVRIHRLDITPAAYNMVGPQWIGANRVLRLYPGHHDRFLKVSFVEEDLSRLRHNRNALFDGIRKSRWASAFKADGISLCGRKFQFLGFSQSSLKEHSVWFVSPFDDSQTGRSIDADTIRLGLGKFNNIRCAPRLAARIGQTFTTTSHSLDITPDVRVKEIEDIVRGGYTFSDGIGTVSQTMIERAWDATATNNKPVVYQVRIGGAKGVLSLDKTLKGYEICLRKSMIKFEAPYTTLEIANKGQILPFFLNRQMIVILETLRLPRENLLRLQEKEIERLQIASTNFEESLKLCQRYAFGQGARLEKILRTLQRQGIKGIFEMPFFRKLYSLTLSYVFKQIKYKSRIRVDRSWKLIGVMDEFKYLKAGEIYVCLRIDDSGRVEYLEGDTLVTRSPALHCGDIQKVRAIGVIHTNHPLSSLYNCVVFSSEGSRPIPNQLSGGDLDGDLFDISQNALLFPPSWESPDAYDTVRPVDSGQCTIDDISQFFLDFILNDNLGQICTRHAIIADQSKLGVKDENCVKLSRLASQAVDFPKTGLTVNIREAPNINTRVKPDFMARQPIAEWEFVPGPPDRSLSPSPSNPTTHFSGSRTYFYESQKVLGEMYRAVDIDGLMRAWNKSSGWNENGPIQLWKSIKKNLQKLVPSYKTKWPEFMKEAEEVFDAYMQELEEIQRYFHPTPWRKQLSESEVFLQCINMAATTQHICGRGRSDFLEQLRQAYSGLVEWVRSQLPEPMEGRYQKAAAYFYVGVHSAQRRPRKEGESFAWLVVPDLFEGWKRVEENGFYDG